MFLVVHISFNILSILEGVSVYMDDHQFAWILWYIWKGGNNQVFSNIDVYPRDTLKLA